MSSFFTSLREKAESAYKESPLASQVQTLQGKLQGTQEHPTANEAAAHGGPAAKNRTLDQLQYRFREMQMQYSTVSPIQRIVTSAKGVALDFDRLSVDAKSQSKELYVWGQHEAEDIKDVTDRLAYLNFVHGTIASNVAEKLNASRSTFKELRNADSNLTPKRNIRIGLQTQISRIEHDQQRGMEKRLAELRQQLARAEEDDEALEKEVELLKRRAVAESEREKWAALRQYAEKVILLAEASASLVSALPPTPPSANTPYKGAESTAATRASLQYALDNYKPNSLSHSFQPSAADLKRSESRSFGVTHASELQDIATQTTPTGQTASPPAHSDHPVSHPTASITSQVQAQSPPPINPANLNNTPAQIPATSPTTGAPITAPAGIPVPLQDVTATQSPNPNVEKPTVAETGVPISASSEGPGPQSGSLHDLKASRSPEASPIVAPSASAGKAPAYGVVSDPGPAQYETAEQEKQRLQREERERLLQGSGNNTSAAPATGPSSQAPAKYETAEEEKKRLEREERERILREGGNSENQGEGGADKGPSNAGNPPPYQDL